MQITDAEKSTLAELEAVLFDLDGTLSDNLSSLKQGFATFLQKQGRKVLDLELEFAEINGPSLEEIVRFLREKHQLEKDPAVLLDEYIACVHGVYSTTSLRKDSKKLLSRLYESNIKSVIVTSATRHMTDDFIKIEGIGKFIFESITCDDVVRRKPAPDPYLKALDVAETTAARAIAIEDSQGGSASALEAGCLTYKFGEPISHPRLFPIASFQDILDRLELAGR